MKFVRVLFALLLLQGTAQADPLMEYRVKPGDTCEGVAKAVYGDPKRIDLIHQYNPMGPPPHHLVPGTILRLPPPKGTPDALLSFVWNLVDKFTPEKGRGTKDDPLKRGDRVYTEASSSAEVTFQDDSRLQLGETTLVVILGDSSGRVVKGADADDTTLVSGSLRAHLGELVGRKPRAVATAAGRVDVDGGEAQVDVDKAQTTRLSVYKGTSSLTAQQKRVRVAAGYGSKAEKGRPPTPPHALPPVPAWIAPPPPFLLATTSAGFVASYGAGAGHAPAHWHVQVASDERFNALKVDTRVDAAITRLDVRELTAGTWFVRVSAIDDDNFEGPFLTPSVVQVATAALTQGAPGMVRIALSAPGLTLSCGLDGEPLTPRTAPFEVPERRARTLRCAPAGATAIAAELSLPVAKLTASARLTATGPEAGTLDVTAVDETGRAVPGLELLARPQAPLTLGAFHESDGHYLADARWPAGVRHLSADLSDAQGTLGAVTVDVPAIAPAPVVTEAPRRNPSGTSMRLGFAWVWSVTSAPALDLSIAQRVWGTPHLDINVDLDAVNSYFGQGGSDLIGAGAEIDWFPQRTTSFAWGLGVQLNYAFELYESADHRSYGNGGELQGQLLMRWSVSPVWALGFRLHGGGFGAVDTGWGGMLGIDFVVIRHGEE